MSIRDIKRLRKMDAGILRGSPSCVPNPILDAQSIPEVHPKKEKTRKNPGPVRYDHLRRLPFPLRSE